MWGAIVAVMRVQFARYVCWDVRLAKFKLICLKTNWNHVKLANWSIVILVRWYCHTGYIVLFLGYFGTLVCYLIFHGYFSIKY